MNYEITTKDHIAAGGIILANNTELFTIPELINYAILAAIIIQICYTTWKWYKDYTNHKHRVKLRKARLSQLSTDKED